MLNKMGMLKSDWGEGNDGSDGMNPPLSLGGAAFDPGGPGMYQGPPDAGDNNGLFTSDGGLLPDGNYGSFDPGGEGVYNGSPTGIPNGGGGNPFGNFNLNNLMGGNTGTLIQAFLDDQNRNTAQNQINDMVNRGIPYDQSNRNAASDRLTGLTNGTINASTDPAFMANLQLNNENLMRQFNAHGMNLSGNEIGALGQQNLAAFNKYRQDELEREMTRSGASFNPSSTANAGITAAAFMAAMRGNNLSALMAGLNRGPSTVINNNAGPGNNNSNGPGNNTRPGNNNTTPGNGRLPNGLIPDGGPVPDFTFNPGGNPGQNLDDAPDFGNNSGNNFNGSPDYGDPFGGGNYDVPFDPGSADFGDFDWGTLGEW